MRIYYYQPAYGGFHRREFLESERFEFSHPKHESGFDAVLRLRAWIIMTTGDMPSIAMIHPPDAYGRVCSPTYLVEVRPASSFIWSYNFNGLAILSRRKCGICVERIWAFLLRAKHKKLWRLVERGLIVKWDFNQNPELIQPHNPEAWALWPGKRKPKRFKTCQP